MNVTQTRHSEIILHGAKLPETDIFSPTYLREQNWLQGDTALGRGSVHFFEYQQLFLVLRHYQRGGLLARFVKDKYFWSGLERTRAWREFQLLEQIEALGLPASRPFAARINHSGFSYQADLITHRLSGGTLLERIRLENIEESLWFDIGKVIHQFHAANIYHSDLNVNNIMLSDEGTVSLIDFDKGAIRHDEGWQQDNLDRLLRSLNKQCGLDPSLKFSMQDWDVLNAGYRESEVRRES